jgi:4-hydroxythreonine-4-phosphate dehydrogenase
MISPKKILITSGDHDGIGFEVSAKALKSLGPQSGVLPILYLKSGALTRFENKLLSGLQKKFAISSFTTLTTALREKNTSARDLFLIRSSLPPAKWVEESAQACLGGRAQAMATAPLSKPEIQNSGMSDLGHTDILKRVCGRKSAYMCFLGAKFNVILASGHVPVQDIPASLSIESLVSCLTALSPLLKILPANIRRRPLGILGLNPHAGDQGLIGDFEKNQLGSLLSKMRSQKIKFDGPLVPDVAFQPQNWKKYSIYMAMYHDQGLIPFKVVHGFESGVHLTLGLPIWRTSVDHGTAKDIYGTNKANPNSMKEALIWAMRLARSK